MGYTYTYCTLGGPDVAVFFFSWLMTLDCLMLLRRIVVSDADDLGRTALAFRESPQHQIDRCWFSALLVNELALSALCERRKYYWRYFCSFVV